MANTVDNAQKIIDELSVILNFVNNEQAECLIDRILAVKRADKSIYISGAGRSLLMIRSFAMRLMRIGLTTYVVGETITPAIKEGDLLILGSGSGETSTLTIVFQKAKKAGAQVALITCNPASTLGKQVDFVVNIPIEKGKRGFQPSGSTFEQGMLLRILEKGSLLSGTQSIGDFIMQRHANLE